MAELNREVLERVREELSKRPHIGSGVLHQMAQWIDPSLGKLSLKAFQARYVFPVRHELGLDERRTTRSPTPGKKRQRRGSRQRRIPVATGSLPSGAAPAAPAPAAPPLSAPAADTARAAPAAPAAATPAPDQPPSSDGGAQRQRQAADRDRIRAVFLQVARDFAEADSAVDIVAVFSKLDDYVARLVEQLR